MYIKLSHFSVENEIPTFNVLFKLSILSKGKNISVQKNYILKKNVAFDISIKPYLDKIISIFMKILKYWFARCTTFYCFV